MKIWLLFFLSSFSLFVCLFVCLSVSFYFFLFLSSFSWHFFFFLPPPHIFLVTLWLPISHTHHLPFLSHSLGLNYKDVNDPACVVSFPLISDPEVSLLAWTTTPWTLPSNLGKKRAIFYSSFPCFIIFFGALFLPCFFVFYFFFIGLSESRLLCMFLFILNLSSAFI